MTANDLGISYRGRNGRYYIRLKNVTPKVVRGVLSRGLPMVSVYQFPTGDGVIAVDFFDGCIDPIHAHAYSDYGKVSVSTYGACKRLHTPNGSTILSC